MKARRGRTGATPGPPVSGRSALRRGPGSHTRDFWDRASLRWERFEPQLMYALSAVDPALLLALAPRPGHHVLDLGSGQGEPALAIAQLVGPRGRVVGLDLSPRMVTIARLRARQRRVTNARFRVADIARAKLGRNRYHGIVSRFGLMFPRDTARVLGAVRGALRPGGRAAFAVWGPLARNPISALSAGLVRKFSRTPPPPPESGPHPLRFGRRGALASLMREAGFRAVRPVGVHAPTVFGSERECMAMYLGFPNPLRDHYLSLSLRDRARMRARFLRGIRRFRSGSVVRVPGFAWVVAGRR